jgi:hypothetical protein
MKMAVKAKLMYDEKQLTMENTMHAADPLDFLAAKVRDALTRSIDAHDKTPIDPSALKLTVDTLSANMARVRDMIVQIIEPLMQEKNVEIVRHIFIFLGDTAFLHFLLSNEDVQPNRIVMRDSLSKLLQGS